MCVTYISSSLHNDVSMSDEGVQVDQKNHLLNRYIYATSDMPQTDAQDTHVFCPNCYFIWDILRRTAKVFKDEESEMKPTSSDKSTEKVLQYTDTATVTNKPTLEMSSNLMFSDFISETSVSTSVDNRIDNADAYVVHPESNKSNHDRVTFLDVFPSKDEIKAQPFPLHGNCFCLDNLIDSIRPPIPKF